MKKALEIYINVTWHIIFEALLRALESVISFTCAWAGFS